MQMSHRKDPSSVRIREVLLEMRRYRMGLIQTADQLRFSYLAVIEGAKYIGRDGDLSLQASPTSLLQNNTFHSVYCLFRFRYKSHSIKTTHLFLFSLEYFCTQSGLILFSRIHGKSSQMRKTMFLSSPPLLRYLRLENHTMANLSQHFSPKIMRSSSMWSSTVLGNFFKFRKILHLWVIMVYVTLKKQN